MIFLTSFIRLLVVISILICLNLRPADTQLKRSSSVYWWNQLKGSKPSQRRLVADDFNQASDTRRNSGVRDDRARTIASIASSNDLNSKKQLETDSPRTGSPSKLPVVPLMPASTSPTIYSDLVDPPPKSVISLVNANNIFGFKLCQALIEENGREKNVFISPLSLFSTLVTVYTGSSAETADEMINVLELRNLTEKEVQNGYRDILHTLLLEVGKENTLKILNAILVDRDMNVSSEYTNTVRLFYNAYLEKVGFGSEPDFVLHWVNKLVSWWTQGNIPTILDKEPDPLTKLLLINAIYFKGRWAQKFDSKFTTELPFHNQNGDTSMVPMMRLTSRFRIYCENATYKACALEIPYTGDALNFLIITPFEGTNLSDLDDKLNPVMVSYMVKHLEERSLELGLPKFSLKGVYDLHKPLERMGMKAAFAPDKADLSRMTCPKCKNDDLFVTDAKHKSVIQISEDGTEASAASFASIGNRIGSQRFYVDRPFIFMIRDLRSDAILFLGRIASLP